MTQTMQSAGSDERAESTGSVPTCVRTAAGVNAPAGDNGAPTRGAAPAGARAPQRPADRHWFDDGVLHFGLGIEDTFVPQSAPGERPIDEYELTDHYRQYAGDLALAAQAGATFLRWGVPWYRVNPDVGVWDFEWTDRVVDRFAELGLRPVIDLLHYGTPLWLDDQFANPDYPKRVAEYGVRVAERYADMVSDYTPVNEPMIHALFCGAYGYWPPYLHGDDGLVRMVRALGEGLVRTQQGITQTLGGRACFIHVDAGMRYTGRPDGEHGPTIERLREQAALVTDLVTGAVGAGHPLLGLLTDHGTTDAELAWFAANAVHPDVVGVNYYPRHSTEVLVEGARHLGGFADPRPTQDDGVAGLVELLVDAERRYGVPVMLTETCVTGSVGERVAWLGASVSAIRRLRDAGHRIAGYTWWPVFDMYEWTYRHGTGPRADYLLTMGLWDLVEEPDGLARRRNDAAIAYRALATDHAANAAPAALLPAVVTAASCASGQDATGSVATETSTAGAVVAKTSAGAFATETSTAGAVANAGRPTLGDVQ